jgi:pimeloyl-ACP methyl ester carboxylesterase
VARTSARAIETFRSAAEIQTRWTRVSIPYQGVHLTGYYLNVSGDEPGRTLLAHGGFDSTVEEMYFVVGEAARRYGWNCLVFEGPGQGAALRDHGLPMRPDWEAVVTPVVDVALGLRGVDPDRIALLGMSLGGYLAPRAVAFEPRIAACIAYDGMFRFGAGLSSVLAGSPAQASDPAQQVAALDRLIAERSSAPTLQRWALSSALWVLGVSDAAELLREVGRYDLTDVAGRITCPTLVCAGEEDLFGKEQPAVLYDALTCPKTFIEFTAAEGAGEHCQEGALTLFHQRMFDWLDETLPG